MMDATLRALFAIDEIPRARPDWRVFSNRPVAYLPVSSMKTLPRR